MPLFKYKLGANMPYKDPIVKAQKKHEYYIIHKEERKTYDKEYRTKNREAIKEKSKIRWIKYYVDNKEKIQQQKKIYYRKYGEKHTQKCLNSWSNYIGKNNKCEICNKKIVFNGKSTSKSIHFDHRYGGTEAIKTTPSTFMRSRVKNDRFTKVWKSCNFGKLCYVCNKNLPTFGRKMFIKNAVKYVFGKNYRVYDDIKYKLTKKLEE